MYISGILSYIVRQIKMYLKCTLFVKEIYVVRFIYFEVYRSILCKLPPFGHPKYLQHQPYDFSWQPLFNFPFHVLGGTEIRWKDWGYSFQFSEESSSLIGQALIPQPTSA